VGTDRQGPVAQIGLDDVSQQQARSQADRGAGHDRPEGHARAPRSQREVFDSASSGVGGRTSFLVEQEAALRRMKLFATGLLLLMVCLFIVSRFFEGAYPFLGAVAAFAEAATVGALADWFAVVALFKHPLNLPIPRTAVIPRNRDRIGDALARFIRENFLSKEVLEGKISSVDLAGVAAAWMSDEANASQMAERLAEYLPHLAEEFLGSDGGGQEPSRQEGPVGQAKTTVAALVQAVSEPIRQSALFRRLTIDVLSALEKILTDQGEKGGSVPGDAREEKTPAASPVDKTSRYGRYRDLVHAGIGKLRRSVGGPLFDKINAAAGSVLDREGIDERASKGADDLGRELIRHPRLKQYLPGMWKGLKGRAMRELANPGPDFVRQVAKAIQQVGTVLAADEHLKTKVNQWLRTWATDAAADNRELLVTFISETVKRWDPEATSRRIELHVGRDLQWIRINGTIVGGLAGLLIYVIYWIARSLH